MADVVDAQVAARVAARRSARPAGARPRRRCPPRPRPTPTRRAPRCAPRRSPPAARDDRAARARCGRSRARRGGRRSGRGWRAARRSHARASSSGSRPLEQRQRPAERGLGLVAAPPPGLELAELEPQLGALGRDRERLLEVGRPPARARRRRARRGRRAHELRDRLGIGAGEPQMARHLGGARDRAGPLAGQQRVRPAMVQPAPARLGDLLVDGVAQQRVAERDAVAGSQQQARLRARRSPPPRDRSSGSRPSSTASSGRAATAASSTSSRASATSGASVARTDPRRLGATSSRPAAERPRGLHGEQRVAFGALDHARRRPRSLEAGRVAGPAPRPASAPSGPRSSSQASSPRARSACSSRSASALLGQLAPRDQHHHPQPGHAAGGVAGQLEARRVGGVDVLEHEQQRRLPRRPAEQRDHRLEQPRALQVGRDGRARRAAAREVRRQLRRRARPGRRARPPRRAAPAAPAAARGSARPTGSAVRSRPGRAPRHGRGRARRTRAPASAARSPAASCRSPPRRGSRPPRPSRRRPPPTPLELGRARARGRPAASSPGIGAAAHARDRMRRRRRAQPLDQLARLPPTAPPRARAAGARPAPR